MLIGKADTVLVERARVAVTDSVAPILRFMSEPASAVSNVVSNVRELAGIRDENAELREANARLLQWQSVAQKLETENKSLRSLLAVTPEPTASFVTGRVVADAGGAFAQSVIVMAGRSDGVRRRSVRLSSRSPLPRSCSRPGRSSALLARPGRL